eukprot:CAMPEP_0185798320 /NCGR_PEP_ID=MMETSP1174-20130828/162084_1 /TAXON_ID=35687 /ORGANISM="Dictyocha speculum, Strain CCMP1381" /LENGTH=52 /DNA_ID=CAMNT_0028493807 /DNA_START=427 /DNA_END=582 /DNA_ORIENTATION=+
MGEEPQTEHLRVPQKKAASPLESGEDREERPDNEHKQHTEGRLYKEKHGNRW